MPNINEPTQTAVATKTKTKLSLGTKTLVSVAILGATGGFAAGVVPKTDIYKKVKFTVYTTYVRPDVHAPYSSRVIITSNPPGIGCLSPNAPTVTPELCGSAVFPAGTQVTLSLQYETDGAFVNNWNSPGCVHTSDSCTVMLRSSQNLTAEFIDPVSVFVRTHGAGQVLYTPQGRLKEQADGVEVNYYAYGTPITLTAQSAPGTAFLNWYGTLCEANPTSETCSFSAITDVGAGPHTEATFSGYGLDMSMINGSSQYGGTITCKPSDAGYPPYGDCGPWFEPNQPLTITAEPFPNSIFVGWDGDCQGSEPICELVMDSNKSVEFEFGLAP